MARLRELALQKRIPLIWLLDSAGARIQEAAGSLFAGSGHLFREEVEMSGVVPLVAAMLGPCAAGTAYIPGLSDFVPMVVGQGAMALGGPAPDQGGHRRGHLDGGPRRGEGALPQVGRRRPRGQGRRRVHRGGQALPLVLSLQLRAEAAGPRDRRIPTTGCRRSCSTIVPDSNRKPYDMYEVIAEIVDDGEWFDIKPRFARTIITCLARFGGQPVGIVANQPKQLGGILENDSADKAARFVNLCDAFEHPARLPPGRPRLHGRLEGRARRDHPPRGEDALRDLARDGPEGDRRRPQGLRRRLLRDERPRLRAGPDRTPGRRPRSRSWAPRAR